ncbi:hypothetical protein MKX01_042094, partial [Papaver californicum]
MGLLILVYVVNLCADQKGGKKSSSSSLQYEAPLGYCIEDIRPNGEIEKFISVALKKNQYLA